MGDVEAISIRPNRSRASRFQLSQEQFMTIRSLSLFVLPEAFGDPRRAHLVVSAAPAGALEP